MSRENDINVLLDKIIETADNVDALLGEKGRPTHAELVSVLGEFRREARVILTHDYKE